MNIHYCKKNLVKLTLDLRKNVHLKCNNTCHHLNCTMQTIQTNGALQHHRGLTLKNLPVLRAQGETV